VLEVVAAAPTLVLLVSVVQVVVVTVVLMVALQLLELTTQAQAVVEQVTLQQILVAMVVVE
jgi:hypothetical protein